MGCPQHQESKREARQVEDRTGQVASHQRNSDAEDESYLSDVEGRKAKIGKFPAEERVARKNDAEKTEIDADETWRRRQNRICAGRRHRGYQRFNAAVVIAGR
jgi:hypothetical protein